MTHPLALLVAFLVAALLCVRKAVERDSFSLWDVGYYLAALGVILCVGRLVHKGRSGRGTAGTAR